MSGTMPTVVFDTNVLIPLLVPADRSRSTRLFSRVQKAGWEVAISPQILGELYDKLRTKERLRRWLKVTDEQIEHFVEHALPSKTRVVPGLRQVHGVVKADPTDDKILAAAAESGAGYIVSEDWHLLDLKEWQGIKIMSRLEFEAELDRLWV